MTRFPASSDPKELPELRKCFAENLRRARKAAGMTQVELCDETGLAQPYISEVERGLSNISLDTMEKIAEAVGKPLWTMLRKPRSRTSK